MVQYIDKAAVVAEIIRRRRAIPKDEDDKRLQAVYGNEAFVLTQLLEYINTLEVKEVDLIIHTIIAECCDWLAMRTNLSHDEIEGCRNLMLTIKEEQFKAQKGE